MNQLFMPRGTLARMSRERNLVSDMLLLEHRPNGYTKDELTSVRVVTLREFAHECAIKEAAMELTTPTGLVGDTDYVDAILRDKFPRLKEFVAVNDDHEFLIAVDRITVDDAAVTYALELLFDVDDTSPGSYQQFGEWVELDWC